MDGGTPSAEREPVGGRRGFNMRRVLLWRGGVRFYEPGAFIFDPRQRAFIGPEPPLDEPVVLIDANIFGGHTLHQAAAILRKMGYQIAGFAGSLVPGSPMQDRVLVVLEPPPMGKPIVFISGLAATGKSAVAAMIAIMSNAPYIKWSRFVSNPGRYGEMAAEREREDPLIFARAAIEELRAIPPETPIVLDGVKDLSVVYFLSYATSRPAILIYVEAPASLRQFIMKHRGHPDDRFWQERDQLFRPRLEEIRQNALVMDLASNDHREIVQVLSVHGIKPRLPMQSVPALLDKFFVLDFIEYIADHPLASLSISDIPEEWVFHRRYVERYRVPDDLRSLVCVVASAFRIIDDILDESQTRVLRDSLGERMIEAMWVSHGIWVAIARAMAMLSAAVLHPIAPESGFRAMLRRVVNAVRVEMRADAENRPLTREEYELTLDREIAFREWVARISGYPIDLARKEAIEAQMKNDAYAARSSKAEDALERRRVERIFNSEEGGATW